ncbi:MAG: hypothetical protein KGJ93_01740 [Patescibacteria group bacterium]|nr:hypothetical protein [Patescibacteria group bacterium]
MYEPTKVQSNEPEPEKKQPPVSAAGNPGAAKPVSSKKSIEEIRSGGFHGFSTVA